VSSENMNGAIHNDLVVVELIKNNGLKQEGRVVRVLERKTDTFVGEFCLDKKNRGYIELDDAKVKLKIVIDKDKDKGAMPGHKVLVKAKKEKSKGVYSGEVLKIIGHKNDPGVDILSIVYTYGINDVFSDEVMNQVEAIEESVSIEETKKRRDLREEQIVTIDGNDAKDLDDAISIKKLEDGNYLLGVHIADVSYYVKKDTPLDEEAYDRGTSVYLADRVIPMLPHKLSNGICSLNEAVDRLTLTCEMEIDKEGNVVKYDIYESVINSKKRMTYEAVNSILVNNIVPTGYESFVDMINLMEELSLILSKNRTSKGSIDFESEEVKIIVDENGKAIDIKKREHGLGEKLIENFMILANETVASHIYFMNLPFVYRIHENPKPEKIREFINFVAMLGYQITGVTKKLYPKEIQSMLEQLRDKKEFPLFSTLLLRSMKKAIYSRDNVGHYGLASKCYTHFTSPIRRYPDTTVHRLLREYLFLGHVDKENTSYWHDALEPLAIHSSEKERDAQDCEREVDDMKKAEYMMQYIGKEFTGIISGVMNFGMFVELDNTVEGLVHVNDMDDFYILDEATMSLVGERKKKRYRIGDSIRIKVKAASKEAKTIDFEIVE
jgi:ribonuclease R